MPTELTRIFMPFAEVQKSTVKGADGKDVDIRLVKGLMTDESKDLDGQIVDADWAKDAGVKWHSRWGNIREQHSHNAIGKSVEMAVLEQERAIDLTGKIVDPGAIVKIDNGILQGWSVGIRGARVVKDAKAPNGRIIGGEIIEVSLVDHPANENCKVALVKAAKSGDLEDVEQSVVEKVAETETAKDSILDDLAADIDGLNEDDTVPPGKQTAAEPGSGTGTQLDVTPESALARRKKKRQPDAPKAGEPDTEKGVTTQVQPNGTVTVWAADAEPIPAVVVEAAVTAADSDLGGSLTAIEPTGDKSIKPQTTKSEEDIEMLFAKAFTEVKDLLTKGDTNAALAVIQATEVLSKTAAVVEPVATAPVVETPAVVEPIVTTDKAASADTLKATISEAVTKAVETAVKSLQEKVEAMEKRAAPGGPLLSGTRMLSAPEAIKGQFAKDRIEDIQKMADEHPDGAMRQGARELLAEITKNA